MPTDQLENFQPSLDLDLGPDAGEIAILADPAQSLKRRGGRAKGAKNLATRAVIGLLDARGHKDPLVAFSELFSLGPHGLAQAFGFALADAFAIWRDLGETLLPYRHAKMPVAIDVTMAPAIPIAFLDPEQLKSTITSTYEPRPVESRTEQRSHE